LFHKRRSYADPDRSEFRYAYCSSWTQLVERITPKMPLSPLDRGNLYQRIC
jgi:hypothetical protein